MVERGIARDGYKVLNEAGQEIGYVTSGSPAPFLKKNIALAYVPPEFAALGLDGKVEIRGQGVKAQVVPTPFYKRPKKTTDMNQRAQEQSQREAMPYPSDFKYTKEHEWIKPEGKNATIGITSYAQDSLGDIVFVDLPKARSRNHGRQDFWLAWNR